MGWSARITLVCGAALIVAACGNKGSGGTGSADASGCTTDKDCKGDRVCESGKCVDAGKKEAGGGSTATPTSSDPAAAMDALATKMCACADGACATKVSAEITDWIDKHKADKVDSATATKLEAATKKAGDCSAKASTAAAPTADSTRIPECDAYLKKLVDCGMMTPEQVAPLRDGYKRAVEAGPAIVASTAKTCADSAGSVPCINTSLGGPSCVKAAACCRAITNDPEADAKLNVRMGTATKADTLASCDQLEKAPATACDSAQTNTRDLIKQRLTPAQQARIASACD